MKAALGEARRACLEEAGGEKMTENNTARSEVMILVFVLLGQPSENTVKLKTVLQNKTAGGGAE